MDCGLFQGSKETEKQNSADFPFNPAKIDAVVLSHAHLYPSPFNNTIPPVK
jgi:metallo-beta-lactamase family protein